MLGDGIVSFGVVVVVSDFRVWKASPKIVFESPTRSWTLSAAVVNSTSPSSLWNATLICSSAGSIPPAATIAA